MASHLNPKPYRNPMIITGIINVWFKKMKVGGENFHN
jgi:hypothetical protein